MKPALMVSFVALLVSPACWADDGPLPRLDVALGYGRDYATKKNYNAYSIKFGSKSILAKGTLPDPITPDSALLPKSPGSYSGYLLSLKDGFGKLGGSLLEGEQFQAFSIPQLSRSPIMLSGYAGFNPDSPRKTRIEIGAHFATLHPLRSLASVTNWATLGVAHASVSQEGSQSRSVDLLTTRAFAGKSLWEPAQDQKKKIASLNDEIVELSKKLRLDAVPADVAKYAKDHKTEIKNNEIATAMTMYGDEVKRDVPWAQWVAEYAAASVQASGLTARFKLYVEAQAQYALSKQFDQRRYNSLWGATLDYDLSPLGDHTTYVLFRYQNGYQRGDPTIGTTGLQVQLGIRF